LRRNADNNVQQHSHIELSQYCTVSMNNYEKKIKPQYLKDLATWRNDERFTNSAAVRLWNVHNGFRDEAVNIMRKKKPSKRAFNDLLNDIHKHHKGEDNTVFPKMQKKFDINVGKMRELEGQHVQILELEKNVRKLFDEVDEDEGVLWELRSALDELFGLFTSHLALEEQTLMPHLLEVKSFAEIRTW
jgi:hypothetical protein